jgi:uncharacterized protein YabN with tetrapyrrole methylase and pyrophosphatase domain
MTNETLTYDYWCSQLVTLSRESDVFYGGAVSGNLEEIGETTALVLAEEPIQTGIKVKISSESGHLQGVVDSCTYDQVLGYFVRMQLAQESRWSKDVFAPEHLLAVPRAQPDPKKSKMAA